MIKIKGDTNPFLITLTNDETPFAINTYLKILDSENNNPICRIISTSSSTKDGKTVHIANAKIETSITKPIDPNADVVIPEFDDMRPYIMKINPEDGFKIGEVLGTESLNTPTEYTNLFPMIYGGKVCNQNSVPFIFNYKKLYESPHIGLFGGSGSGKTFALKVLAEELMKRGIPTILLDPHLEMNFSAPKPGISKEFTEDFRTKFAIFTIGHNVGIKFSELNSDELVGIMSFSGELTSAMESLIRALHKYGDTLMDFQNKITNLISAFMKTDQGIPLAQFTMDEQLVLKKYKASVPHPATLQALSWRLAALNSSNIFNKDAEEVYSAIKKQKLCVIRGPLSQLNILSSYLISKFYSERRKYVDAKELGSPIDFFPPFVVAMDESHLFCPRGNKYTPTTGILRTIAQEGRKYGVFEILATQRPSLLDETVVAQLASKFIFRISIKEDLASIAKETDLSDEEIMRLPYMDSGECYISSAITGKTISVKIRSNTTQEKNEENPFDELSATSEISELEKAVLAKLPINDLNIDKVVTSLIKETGNVMRISDVQLILDGLHSKGKVKICNTGMFGNEYILEGD